MNQTPFQKKLKQILAIVCLIIIAALYITTLALAVLGSDKSGGFLMASLFATIVLPGMMYIILWLYRLLSDLGKK